MNFEKFSGFYKKSWEERLNLLKESCNLSNEDIELLKSLKPLNFDTANIMIENVIGVLALPLAVAPYFRINGKDYIVPMSIEEPSVVAAASRAAKMTLPEGFKAEATQPIMIGQIQLLDIADIEEAKQKILNAKNELLQICNRKDSTLVKLGGGAKDIQLKEFNSKRGKMLVLHLLVDVRDAMGANAVNTMAETVAKKLEEMLNCRSCLRIISNLCIYRLAKAKAVWKKEVLESKYGEGCIDFILDAYELACIDQFRATTHNKGIMNGIDALALATGNDFRAIEAACHSYACFNHSYRSLTHYYKDDKGNLVGEIELPIACGIVGGSIKTNSIAKLSLKLLNVNSARELAMVFASLGLAQNFAALSALATEGIQKGHMKLHARNIAILAGASIEEAEKVAKKMVEMKSINVATAKKILEEMRK